MADYFTLAEFRTLPQMSDAAKYPDAAVDRAAAYITAIIERECGTSFIPRAVTETLDGSGTGTLVLSSPYARSLTSVSVGGVAVAVGNLTATGGVLRYLDGSTSWSRGAQNVTVAYQAGYTTAPPADIKEAAMQGTRARLLETASTSLVDDRRTGMTTDTGGTINFVIAGENRPTGYPTVDAVILGWKRRLDMPGFA